jgi:6-pyruvoyl-tetrahydropterin synthase
MVKLFIKKLTVIDFSVLDEEIGLIGNSLMVNVSLDGELNPESIIMDFSVVKKTIKRVIDDLVDHVLVVPVGNKNILIECSKSTTTVSLLQPDGLLKCYVSGPSDAFLLLPSSDITVTELEHVIEKSILDELPHGISGVSISLESEVINGVSYHYSHGLKKHDGNCQRIAHGHRSTMHIYVEGQRNVSLEQYWAERWNNTYLLTAEDIVSVGQLSTAAAALWHPELIASAYYGSQGRFELLTLKDDTEILPGDTTVESLALYIHDTIRAHLPTGLLEVHAFEGIDKGAIAV